MSLIDNVNSSVNSTCLWVACLALETACNFKIKVEDVLVYWIERQKLISRGRKYIATYVRKNWL